MIENGKISHWAAITKYLPKPYLAGFGGKSNVDRIDDKTRPLMAMVIKVRATTGKLVDNTVSLKRSPPRIIGSHPMKAMMRAFVAQE